jgi:peptide/nickel transport system substrate-binding protein
LSGPHGTGYHRTGALARGARRLTWLAVAGAIVVAGCGGDDSSSSRPDDAAGGTPATSGVPENVPLVRIQHAARIRDLDPVLVVNRSDINVLHLLGGTLFAFAPGAADEVVPALAESAEASDDGMEVTVTLKPDLKFDDGSPLTARDVKSTFDRALATPSTRNDVAFDAIRSVAAQGDDTVVFKLRYEQPRFTTLLAGYQAAIVPRAAATDEDFFTGAPVFAGPYKLESEVQTDTIELARNAEYTGPRPVVERIVFQVTTDPYAALTQFEGGQLDYMDAVPPDRFRELEGRDDIVTHNDASVAAHWLTFMPEGSPAEDPKVRQAIATAINREQLGAIAYQGLSEPFQNPLPTVSDEEMFPAQGDVEAAKRLLAGTECASGCELTLNGFTGEQEATSGRMATAIQQMVQPLGIDITYTPLESATMVENLLDGSFQSFIIAFQTQSIDTWIQYALDPEGGNFAAWSRWDQPDLHDLAREAYTAQSDDERQAAYDALSQRFAEDVPWIPLVTVPKLTATKPELDKVVLFNPGNYIDIATAE